MKVSFVKLVRPVSGAVGVGITHGGKLGKTGQAVDRATGGALSAAMKAAKFSGQSGKTVSVYAPPRSKLTRVVAFGLGKAKELSDQTVEEAGGSVIWHSFKRTPGNRGAGRPQRRGSGRRGHGCRNCVRYRP